MWACKCILHQLLWCQSERGACWRPKLVVSRLETLESRLGRPKRKAYHTAPHATRTHRQNSRLSTVDGRNVPAHAALQYTTKRVW